MSTVAASTVRLVVPLGNVSLVTALLVGPAVGPASTVVPGPAAGRGVTRLVAVVAGPFRVDEPAADVPALPLAQPVPDPPVFGAGGGQLAQQQVHLLGDPAEERGHLSRVGGVDVGLGGERLLDQVGVGLLAGLVGLDE